jgi:sulfide:quinone oxidoreductase
MRVEGAPRVYAAGDATWYPLKQGGVATQQADAAAATIAADAGLPVALKPFSPVLRGILLTGDKPQYIREDEIAEAPLWTPASKVAGRLLGPYLTAADRTLQPQLEDRSAPAGEHQAALELALQAADAAAGWQDHADALRWLRVAEGLNVALPMSYADKRRSWSELAVAEKH